MVDKADTALIIITLVIIVITVIYLLLAYRWRWYPYLTYERYIPEGDNIVVIGESSGVIPAHEVETNKTYAADFCNAMANTENFMSIYCQVPSQFGNLDCSQFEELNL